MTWWVQDKVNLKFYRGALGDIINPKVGGGRPSPAASPLSCCIPGAGLCDLYLVVVGACPWWWSVQVYMDIEIGGEPAGRIVARLRKDVVPKTAEVRKREPGARGRKGAGGGWLGGQKLLSKCA